MRAEQRPRRLGIGAGALASVGGGNDGAGLSGGGGSELSGGDGITVVGGGSGGAAGGSDGGGGGGDVDRKLLAAAERAIERAAAAGGPTSLLGYVGRGNARRALAAAMGLEEAHENEVIVREGDLADRLPMLWISNHRRADSICGISRPLAGGAVVLDCERQPDVQMSRCITNLSHTLTPSRLALCSRFRCVHSGERRLRRAAVVAAQQAAPRARRAILGAPGWSKWRPSASDPTGRP